MPKHIQRVDHVVILAGDLDRAAETYQRFGFTLSPRGVHSDHMGSANHTIMLGEDYFELLSVLKPTPANQKWRDRLATGEGLWATALRTDDAVGLAGELRTMGHAVPDVLDFSRPVDMADGSTAEAAFKVTHFDEPGTVFDGLFACQQLTRETVWLPELTGHANTATGLAAIDGVAAAPADAASQLASLFDADVSTAPDGTTRFQAGTVAITIHPGEAAGWPVRFTGLTIAVADLAAARACLAGVETTEKGGAVVVPAALATGVDLGFTQR